MVRTTLCVLAVVLLLAGAAAAQLTVEDTAGKPETRKIIVTSPGVFKAEVWQASGGGINRFYNLAADPEAKVNLTRDASGVLEIGWHCRGYTGPDREDCCPKHILKRSPRFKKDEKTGQEVRVLCSDGCASWPTTGKKEIARMTKDPRVCGTLEIIEQTPARVRIRAKAPFTWWGIWVHKLTATATYTIYPTGRIVTQIRIENPGDRTVHWSSEYGPHIMVQGDSRKAEDDLAFTWSTPKHERFEKTPGPAEELMLADSGKAKTALMITIPPEAQKVFDRHMRHNGRSIGWDRCGYGSSNVDMPPGYDVTWTCMIQMGTPGGKLAPDLKTPTDALPHAMQYREPAKITGATLVTDDPGDLNKDGYNESEGCHVLKGPGPLAFTYEKGKGAGFCPAFKVVGWAGEAQKSVKVDGKETACTVGLAEGKLFVQVMGTVAGEKVQIAIGK